MTELEKVIGEIAKGYHAGNCAYVSDTDLNGERYLLCDCYLSMLDRLRTIASKERETSAVPESVRLAMENLWHQIEYMSLETPSRVCHAAGLLHIRLNEHFKVKPQPPESP